MKSGFHQGSTEEVGTMPRTVVAGLDGSPESLAAAEWAAREAERHEVPLRLVHAWDWQPMPYAPLAETEPHRHWAERVQREAAEKLRRHHPDLEIDAEQVKEQPVDALLAAAADAELLVLGSRGLSGIGGFLVGSVALSVVAHATRPVVLVRAGEQEQEEHLCDASGRPSTSSPYRDVLLGLDLVRPSDAVIEFAFDAPPDCASSTVGIFRRITTTAPPSIPDSARNWPSRRPAGWTRRCVRGARSTLRSR
jgi:nucleotide-binding universal stress UspA family protein